MFLYYDRGSVQLCNSDWSDDSSTACLQVLRRPGRALLRWCREAAVQAVQGLVARAPPFPLAGEAGARRP